MTDETMETKVPADGKLYGVYDWNREKCCWITLMVTRDPETKVTTVHNVGSHRVLAQAKSWIEHQFKTKPWEQRQ